MAREISVGSRWRFKTPSYPDAPGVPQIRLAESFLASTPFENKEHHMGLYISPPGVTKEEFLRFNAARVTPEIVKGFKFDSLELPICLMDNGHFTALAVGFDKQETLRWFYHDDPRPKQFYLIHKAVLGQPALSGITEDEYQAYIVEGGRQ